MDWVVHSLLSCSGRGLFFPLLLVWSFRRPVHGTSWAKKPPYHPHMHSHRHMPHSPPHHPNLLHECSAYCPSRRGSPMPCHATSDLPGVLSVIIVPLRPSLSLCVFLFVPVSQHGQRLSLFFFFLFSAFLRPQLVGSMYCMYSAAHHVAADKQQQQRWNHQMAPSSCPLLMTAFCSLGRVSESREKKKSEKENRPGQRRGRFSPGRRIQLLACLCYHALHLLS